MILLFFEIKLASFLRLCSQSKSEFGFLSKFASAFSSNRIVQGYCSRVSLFVSSIAKRLKSIFRAKPPFSQKRFFLAALTLKNAYASPDCRTSSERIRGVQGGRLANDEVSK